MKKAMVILIAVLLTVTLAALSGCGEGDQAKEYMEKGDELSVNMKEFIDSAKDDIGELLVDLGVDLATTGTVDSQKVIDEAKSQIDSMIDDGEKAIAEYEEILDLDDVQDYKDYANLRIDAIDSTSKVLDSVKDLLDKIASAEGKSAQDVMTDWLKNNASIPMDVANAISSWEKANSLKKEKNL